MPLSEVPQSLPFLLGLAASAWCSLMVPVSGKMAKEITWSPGHGAWGAAVPMGSTGFFDVGRKSLDVGKGAEGPFSGHTAFPLDWRGGSRLEREADIARPWDSRFALLQGKAPQGTKQLREGPRDAVEASQRRPVPSGGSEHSSRFFLIFTLAGVATVGGAGFSMDRLQRAAHPEKHMLGLAASLSLPWLLAMVWIVHVALRHFARHPHRAEVKPWECNAAVCYLLVVPLLTMLNITVQALWLSGLHSKTEHTAPMGCMIPGVAMSPWTSRSLAELGEKPSNLMACLVSPVMRYTLLGLEALAVVVGVALVTLCGQLCEPEIWWSTAGLAAAAAAVLAAAPAALFCGYIVSTLGGFQPSSIEEEHEGLLPMRKQGQ